MFDLKKQSIRQKRQDIESSYKYPNLAMEIYWRNQGSANTWADHARMTEPLLEAVLRGDAEAKPLEKLELWRFSGQNIRHLFNPRLAFYDLTRRKHYRKVLVIYRKAERLANSNPTYDWLKRLKVPAFKELMSNRLVSRARVNSLLEYIDFVSARGKDMPIRDLPKEKSPSGASNTRQGK